MKYDSESGLYHTLNRQYATNYGRWLSPDPGNAGADERDPQSWNAYGYVMDNPTSDTDPTGLWCLFGVGTTCSPPKAQKQTYTISVTVTAAAMGTGLSGYFGLEYYHWTQANRAWLAKTHPIFNSIVNGLEIGAAYSDLGGEDPEALLGAEGTQVTSKTLWEEGDARIDVENPAPGRRAGQIHYQEGPRGSKQYIYDVKTGQFPELSQAKNDQLLSSPNVQAAIRRGLRYLGL